MESGRFSFTAPSKLKAVILYVFMILLGSALIALLISIIVAATRGIDTGLITNAYFSEGPVSKEVEEVLTVGKGFGFSIGYLISFIGVCFWMRNDLIEDFQTICSNKKKYGILIPVLAVSFAVIAYFIDLLFQQFTPDSNNQASVVSFIKSDAMIPAIISTVILAPVVEELIYRKAIFSVTKPISLVLAYASSIVLFALPHMLSGAESVGIWFLQLIPYLLCGGMLCAIYHISGFNVYASISAHMLNNIVAVVIVFMRRG